MNPLAIALQGIGFGVAMVAVQGFAVSIIEQPAFYSDDDDSAQQRLIRQNDLFIIVASAFVAQKEFE